jgi:L-glutamine-phosphate cytidylyltransferase
MAGDKASGLILAAGRGSRLGQLTETLPKCLILLGGRRLLDWQIRAFRIAGIERIGVVRGYRGRLIDDRSLEFFENPEWERSNMVRSLLSARSWLQSRPVIVCYGDVLVRPRTIALLRDCDSDIALTYDRMWKRLWEERFARPETDAENFRAAEGQVVEIGGKPVDLEQVQGQFMGLVQFAPQGWLQAESFFQRTPSGQVLRMDMTSLLKSLIADGVEVAAVPVDGGWCEVDTARDLDIYRRRIAAAKDWSHDWR